MISVVLTVYKKPEFFQKQLESFCDQTCAKDIDLHIISNNPNIDYKQMVDKFSNILQITFVQKNNQFGPFERHLYAHEKNFDYVITIDDDIYLNKNDIQHIYNSREKNTIKSGYLRVFKKELNTLNAYYSDAEIPGLIGSDYHYGGGGFSITDCSVYNHVMVMFYKIEKKLFDEQQIKLSELDDLFVSWVAQQYNYKITSHGVSLSLEEHDHALYKKIMNKKGIVVSFLHKIHPWKPIDVREHRKKQIEFLYQSILDRKADDGGLFYYLNSIHSIKEIKNILKNSQEYIGKKNNSIVRQGL
jgi:hypothetical protein